MRHHPRFPDRQQVLLRIADRNELRPLWMRDMSKGGLYLEADPPPPLRSRIVVTLKTPDGSIDIDAEVVHVSPGGGGLAAGVGVQFTGLNENKRKAIQDYVEGLAARLTIPGEDMDARAINARELQEVVQRFLGGFERDALYEALGAHPDEPTEDLVARIDGLIANLDVPADTVPPALHTRCTHALSLAQRVRRMMMNTVSRSNYDLRHGHTQLHLRRAELDKDICAALRKRWLELYPAKLSQATTHGKQAIALLSQLRLEDAISEAHRALELDPFNFELRDATRDWERRLDTRRSSGPSGMRPIQLPVEGENAPT